MVLHSYEFSSNQTLLIAARGPEAVGLMRNLLIKSFSRQASKEKLNTTSGGTAIISPELLQHYPLFSSGSDAQLMIIVMDVEADKVGKEPVICEKGKPQ